MNDLLKHRNIAMKYLPKLLLLMALLVLSALSLAQTTTFDDMNPPPATGVIEDINHDKKLVVIHDDIYSLAGGLVVYASPESRLQVEPATLETGANIAYLYKGKGNKRTIQQIWLLPGGAGENNSESE
jgi:Cu/Ag efflux protein CusF